ncbi:MAG: hypothetical protein J6Y85_03055 [Alphaproteobacteria bacterium]|nr:hypothetical protein [Alphaproteobacteria bacterium]
MECFIPLILIPHLPTREEASYYLNSQREMFSGLSENDIREHHNANGDIASLLALDLSLGVLHSTHKHSTLNPSVLVENVPAHLPKGSLNRANYANILTLYALITLYDLQLSSYCSQQTHQSLSRLLQTLQAIDIVERAVSDYASKQKSQQATTAAAKHAERKGNPPPPPKQKYVSAREILQGIPQNTYLNYGRKLVINRLTGSEVWDLDHCSETTNPHHAHRLHTISRIVSDVFRKLKPYTIND